MSQPDLQKIALDISNVIVSVIIAVKTIDAPWAAPMLEGTKDVFFGRFEKIVDERKIRRWADTLADDLTEQIIPLLESESISSDILKYLAPTLAEALKNIPSDASIWLKTGLDSKKIEAYISNNTESKFLSEEDTVVYKRLTGIAGRTLEKSIPELPNFATLSAEAIIKELADLDDYIRSIVVEQISIYLESSQNTEENEQRYEEVYRSALVRELNKPEIFGLDNIAKSSRKYKLSTAFVSLSVNYESKIDPEKLKEAMLAERLGKFDEGDEHFRAIRQQTERIHKLLPKLEKKRLLIRGEAGSGKTTLLNWIVINAARLGFTGEHSELQEHYGHYLPFLIRLRDFANKDLPNYEDFTYLVDEDLTEDMPNRFVQRKLTAGQAMVVIDGVDEITPERREDVHKWLTKMLEKFTNIPVFVSSRIKAISENWLQDEGFTDAILLPMEKNDIEQFISYWHKALLIELNSNDEESEKNQQEVNTCKTRMLKRISESESLRRLARSPLLCAALCAVNHHNKGLDDQNRMEIYGAFVTILLSKRDKDRGIASVLTKDQIQIFIEELAYRMLVNTEKQQPLFVIGVEDSEEHINSMWQELKRDSTLSANEILRELVSRSGVLRFTGDERVEFIHRTLGEYIAARRFVLNIDVGFLVDRAENDLWHETLYFAAGHASLNAQTDKRAFVRQFPMKLIKKIESTKNRNIALLFLTFLDHSAMPINPEFVKNATSTLFPLKSTSEALIVSNAGNLALPFLNYDCNWNTHESAYALDTLFQIASIETIPILKTYEKYEPLNSIEDLDPVINLIIGRIHNVPENIQSGVLEILDGLSPKLILLKLENLPQLRNINILEKFSQLKGLVLSELPNLSNLGNLEKLNHLEELYLLELPQLTQIQNIAKLTQLRILDLAHLPKLTDVKFIKELTKLTDLYLNDLPKLSEIKSIEKLTQLRNFCLIGPSQVSDLSSIEKLTQLNLLALLRLQNVTQLCDISKLTLLEEFDLVELPHVNQIKDVEKLTKLKQLFLHNLPEVSEIKSIKTLSLLENLSLLNLPKISEIKSIETLVQLRELIINDLPEVSEINSITKLTQLKELVLISLPKVFDIKSIEKLTQLEKLTIDDLQEVSEIDSIKKLPHLNELNLYDLPKINIVRKTIDSQEKIKEFIKDISN